MIDRRENVKRAIVIGSGPNGLAAAIVMAQAGFAVDVYEAEAEPGGACRTLPLTLPGFLHDFGSAVHPLAAGSRSSTRFRCAIRARMGAWRRAVGSSARRWHSGGAGARSGAAERELGADGKAWRKLMQPFAERWPQFAEGCLGPVLRIPPHPLLMARFGMPRCSPQGCSPTAISKAFAPGRCLPAWPLIPFWPLMSP